MKITYCISAFLASLVAFTAQALPGPTSATFDKGALFTVAGYEGSSSLSGFPVLVRIKENSPFGFSYDDLHSKSTGADIAFVGMDCAGLPFEIDTWNTEGESLIWVRLPTMANGTQFVMCWGSDSGGKDVCNANPWSDYTGVWHMNETTAGVTTIHDSTANGLDGTSVASSDTKTDGKIGGARFITSNTANAAGSPYDSGITVDMTGDDNADKLAAVNAIVPEFTASFWVRPQNNAQWWYFITRKTADKGKGWGFQQGASGDFKQFRAYGGAEDDSGCLSLSGVSGLAQGTWTKLDAVWMSDKTFKLYVNGVPASQGTLANAAANGNQTKLALGGALAPTANDQKSGRGVYGDMDEIRLRAGALSADWIAADYAVVTNEAFLTAATAEEYEVNNNPLAALQVSDVGFTNAVVTVTATSCGQGATSADVTVEVASSNDFALPVWTTHYTVNADNDVRAFPLTTLDVGTTYYARAIVSNNLDRVLTTPATSFATPIPDPVFSASVNTDHIAPNISLLFTGIGLGTAVTSVTVQVSSTGDFTTPEISKTISVNLTAMPTNVADIALIGLPATSSLHFRFIAENTGGYANVVEQSASSTLAEGDNVWSGLSEDIDDPNAYVFEGGLPAPDKTLYFTTPAGLSPVINRDVAMPSLYFTDGKTTEADSTYLGGYHSCGYDLTGTGVLTFSAEKPLMNGTKGTNVVRNPILFNRSNGQEVYVNAGNGRLDLTGELMLPNGVSNTTMRAIGSWSGGGEAHFGGPSPDFMGTLRLDSNFTLSLDHPCAMTNVSRVFFVEGWGSFTYLRNNTGAPMTFPRCTKVEHTTGWSNTRGCYAGAPFLFPVGKLYWCDRGGNSTIDADLMVTNLRVSKNNNSGDAPLNKYGNGTLGVADTTEWDSNDCKHYIRLYRGCFWPQTAACLPPSGEFYIPNDYVWRSTLGLSGDFNPMLDGSSTPRFFQTSKLASWGFTGFGGERTVCWNADPTLNLTNTTSVTVSIPLGDASHTNVADKAYSDYYAYPARFMFGNRSEFADGTILFLNPIRYEFGQDWDAYTYFESTNHVVAARLRGSLKLGTGNKTWNFSGNSFGGYLALEADNSDFTGKVNICDKGNLLVNSNLVARSVTVQAGSGLGGTGSLSTLDGMTVKSGGALFGGEWNKGGVLTLGGTNTFESGSALRVEAGSSDDGRGSVKLAAGSTLKLTAPIYVDVDTDPRVSPVRGVSCKVLDWSKATFESGSAPTRNDFVVRPESNPDLRKISVSVRDDGLYVGYVSVRCPQVFKIKIR